MLKNGSSNEEEMKLMMQERQRLTEIERTWEKKSLKKEKQEEDFQQIYTVIVAMYKYCCLLVTRLCRGS